MKPWCNDLPGIGSTAVPPAATATGIALGRAYRDALRDATATADRPGHLDAFMGWVALAFLARVAPCPKCGGDDVDCWRCEGTGHVVAEQAA